MKIIKCQYCNELKKTNSVKYINCCSIRQLINKDNWLNMPKKENSNPIKEADIPENDNTLENSEEQGLTETEQVTSPILVKEEEEKEELENLNIEEEKEYTEEDYNFRCNFCNSLFDELNNGKCPNEECQADLTPYL